MRNINNKITGSFYNPGEFNSVQIELENIVASAEFTLDPDGGPSVDDEMLAQTIAAYVAANSVYIDNGNENSYVLSPVNVNMQQTPNYHDGMHILFKPINTNTGASTINVNSLGVKDIFKADGGNLIAGDILSGRFIAMMYDFEFDRFLIIDDTQFSSFLEATNDNMINSRFVKPDGFGTVTASGNIELFATDTPASIPSEFLLCDGSIVSRSTYSRLFNAIGEAFGAGDGSTTFQLPNITSNLVIPNAPNPNVNTIYIIKI